MNIRFFSIADQKISDAVKWYEGQAEGLSRSFLDELDRVVRLVRNYPRIGTEIEPEIRRFLFNAMSIFSGLRNRPGYDCRNRGCSSASPAALLGRPNLTA